MQSHIYDLGSDESEDESNTDSQEDSDIAHNYSEDEGHQMSEGGGSDSLENWQIDLRDCLDNIFYDGEFSFKTQIEYPHNPGLYITGLGTVGLPLSTRDAAALTDICRRSPFGKGDETLVDESVRKTWELNAVDFECRNPKWHPALEKMAAQAIQGLGVQVQASVQPYKLLLYGRGAFFKPHRDTEKVPGMFGTLVVCLPSEHTGGEVRLVHGKNEMILETADSSAFDLSLLAWYSDVQHEVKPVTSGYRLVLTYNLVQDRAQPTQCAAALGEESSRVSKMFHTWNRTYRSTEFLVYPLKHKYTANLSLGSLKGQDAAKGRMLERVGKQHGIFWFLAQMVKETKEDDYFGNDEDEENHIYLQQTKSPSGHPVSLNIREVEPTNLLVDAEELYGDRSAGSEDEGEYTGNENMPSTLRYHDSVIILVRKEPLFRRVASVPDNRYESLASFYNLILQDSSSELAAHRDNVASILERILAELQKKEAPYPSWYGYNASVCREDRPEYLELFERIVKTCYENNLRQVVYQELRKMSLGAKWTESPEVIQIIKAHIAREASSGQEDFWSSWLTIPNDQATSFESANLDRRALAVIRKLLPSSSLPSFDRWSSARLDRLVRSVIVCSQEDADAIMELIPHLAVEQYLKSVLPTVENQVKGECLLRLIHLLATSESVSVETIVKPTLKQAADAAPEAFRLRADDITGDRYQQLSTRTHEVFRVFDCYIGFELTDQTARLVVACLPDVPMSTSDTWRRWRQWLEFIGMLAHTVAQLDDKELVDAVKPFITSVVHAALIYSKESKPCAPRDWARPPPSPCSSRRRFDYTFVNWSKSHSTCEPCRNLHAFITSPTQDYARFAYAKETRTHLEGFLRPREDYIISTDKDHGSPHALIVRKVHGGYENALAQWSQDIVAMRSRLEQLGNASRLTQSCIDSLSPASMGAARAHSGGNAQVSRTSQALHVSSSHQNRLASASVAGMKRKLDAVDIVDLTNE